MECLDVLRRLPKNVSFAALASGLLLGCGGGENASNTIDPARPINNAPTITSSAPIELFENATGVVFTASATDQDGDPITFSIAGGADAQLVAIDSQSGAMRLVQPLDFEAPVDANSDNVLEVEIAASDGRLSSNLSLTLQILDAPLCQLPDPLAAPKEVQVPQCLSGQVMFTRADQIFDAAQSAFIARGINLQYGDRPAIAAPALPVMNDTGANLVRLQLRRNTTAQQVRNAVDALVSDGLVVMVMFWEVDTTGGSDFAVLQRDVEDLWLGRWKDVLLDPAYTDKLMINIVNEWGDDANNFEDYLSTYERLIPQFREAGFWHPIVVDAPNFAQNVMAFQNGRAQRLSDADTLNNLIFSPHAYNFRFNTLTELNQAFDDLAAENIPWLWGEFGDREFEAPDNDVDHLALMERSQTDGVGWIAWSWHGNGTQALPLDMSTEYGRIALTRRGDDIVNGVHGLRNTSVLAGNAP